MVEQERKLRAYVLGTYDTKAAELGYVCDLIATAGLTPLPVNVGTKGGDERAEVAAAEIAAHHPQGAEAVFLDDRGQAMVAMSQALTAWLATRSDIGGVLALGGSGGTSLVAPALQALDVGIPKVVVSTVASGDVAPYVGASDITMMYAVTDIAGLNRISRRVLANAAHALVGMIQNPVPEAPQDKPAIGLTMFGVTTPCVTQAVEALKNDYDCLVFHATGTGGRAMEKLVDSGMIAGVLDSTTTEVCDLLMGGVMSAGKDRLGAVARTKVPYVGSCGALDMVNFGPKDSVPEKYRGRNLYVHNAQVTLMRTTAEENAYMGRWIGEKLNACEGPVRFLIPEGGVSMIDAPGQPFHNPEADAALFQALEETIQQNDRRRLIRLPQNINDPAFSDALVSHFAEVMSERERT